MRVRQAGFCQRRLLFVAIEDYDNRIWKAD